MTTSAECPQCHTSVDPEDAFCRKCGAALTGGKTAAPASPPPRRRRPAATAVPIGPAPAGLAISTPEEMLADRTLLQRVRPIVEGMAITFAMGLLYLLVGVYASQSYVPLIHFNQGRGLLWIAFLAIGAAWASKDERENSFQTGTVTGAVGGLLLWLAELAVFQGAGFSVRTLFIVPLLAATVGLVVGTVTGIIGSPVMVRFPARQKRIALAILLTLIFIATLIFLLPSEDISYHSRVATAYYNHQLFGPALYHFSRALDLSDPTDPAYPDIHNDLAVCYNELKQPDEALTHLRIATRFAPNRPLLRKNLGDFLYNQSMILSDPSLLPEAIDNFEAYRDLVQAGAANPDADVLLKLAHAYLQLNQPAKALPVVQEGVKGFPNNASFPQLLQETQEQISASSSSKPPGSPPPPPGATSSPD